MKQRRLCVAWPGEVSVTIGAPVRYDAGMDPAAITGDLERRVAGLHRAFRQAGGVSSG